MLQRYVECLLTHKPIKRRWSFLIKPNYKYVEYRNSNESDYKSHDTCDEILNEGHHNYSKCRQDKKYGNHQRNLRGKI